jgi:long-subunit acyl-CoA synthetase (AMP-forming)
MSPNQIVEYVNTDGEEAHAGESGELWIKGTKGDWKNPEATKDSLIEDGYFRRRISK